MKIEFLGILGKVIRTDNVRDETAEVVREKFESSRWPREIHSVRITWASGRNILIRKPVGNPDPGHQTLKRREVQVWDAEPIDPRDLCGCRHIDRYHSMRECELARAVMPRLPRQRGN